MILVSGKSLLPVPPARTMPFISSHHTVSARRAIRGTIRENTLPGTNFEAAFAPALSASAARKALHAVGEKVQHAAGFLQLNLHGRRIDQAESAQRNPQLDESVLNGHQMAGGIVADGVLEAQNPFEPNASRRPQRWFVLTCVVAAATVGCFLYFNFWQ